MREERTIFIHHVYFWLKRPESMEDRQQLIEGLKKLSSVSSISRFHIGKPAGTKREVIDATYAISWMLIFASSEDQESYQTDPVHLAFVDACGHLWSRVTVYDSIDV